jgi:hypothetical protein
MNLWPFRRQPKKPQLTINLHNSVQHNVTVAAAWTTYAGTKALRRMGQHEKQPPTSAGPNSPFDEECEARDAMAEFWAAQPEEKRQLGPYLQLLADIRAAGFIREYVWRFLREPTWPDPPALNHTAFAAWTTRNNLAQHHPPTLAFVSGA